LYPKQKAAIFDPRRISCIEASTKSGKTSGSIIWLAEQALKGGNNFNYWWVAPVNVQAEIAFRRMRLALPRESFTAHLGIKTITLFNGAVIWFKSGDHPDGLYGEDVYAAVIDEASRFKEEAWHAVRSTLTATRGHIRIIGNVKGRRGWFYQLARRAEHGEPDMGYHKIVATDAVAAGVLEAEEIEAAKRDLPEMVFRELYLAEPSDDGGNPFGLQHIAACVKPLSSKPAKWWGWDFAKKVDYFVGIGLDEDGVVCRFERWQGVPWGESTNRVVDMTGDCAALADSTGVGDPIVEAIQKRLSEERFVGYQFTQQSKQKLMEGLALAIQSRTVWYPEGVIVQELEQFEYEVTRTAVRYSAPPGYHDDCVCALALAAMCRATAAPTMPVVTGEMLQQIARMGRRRAY
jgi:hypothetical protein